MFPANITRAEAQARAALLRTHSYQVQVDVSGCDPRGARLTAPERNFVTRSAINFESDAGTTHVDVIADQIVDAELDGAPLDTSDFDGTRFSLRLAKGSHQLMVTALHRYSRSGEGLHRFVDQADGHTYLYTQFEPADARRMFANFEQPDLKATFRFTVVAPKEWLVVSNSPAVEPTVDGDLGRWEFEATKPLPTYLTALVAGDYHREPVTYRSQAGEVPGSMICRRSLREHLDTERIVDITQRGFEVFEDAFAVAYPFGTYDQAFVPEYNMGAMENAGLITIRDEYLFRSRATAAQFENRDNTILHELAHMWFGDLVTMRWWDDLWLKESFAEWASHYAQSRIYPDPSHAWAAFCGGRKNWAYRADQLPTTHPIVADMVDLEAVELNFDGITYAKGASVLRQLVAFVGEDKFLAATQAYFAKHAYANTELNDLLAALSAASGRSLEDWSGEWLESSGVNTLYAEAEVDDAGKFTAFSVRQGAPAAHPTLRRHRIGIGCYDLVGDRLTRVDRVECDITGEVTEVGELVGKAQPDLVLLNDDDFTFAKVRLDERSRRTAIAHVDRLDHELARALVCGSAWDMCRDAGLPVGEYLDLVLRGVGTETEMSAITRTLGQTQAAIDRYVPSGQRSAMTSRFASGLARLVRDAAPGSDHQLLFVRSLARAIDSGAGIDLLRAWLDGEEVPTGLRVDADLRWHLVTQLARLGAIGVGAIDDELARDNTITGAQRALGARAAVPTEGAKARAWQLATASSDVPNESHRHLCMEFWQPGQAEILEPYVERYLDLAEIISGKLGVWRDLGSALSQNALQWLFPRFVDDEAVLTRLDAWQDQARLNDSTRRIIAECRADTVRAVAAQRANP